MKETADHNERFEEDDASFLRKSRNYKIYAGPCWIPKSTLHGQLFAQIPDKTMQNFIGLIEMIGLIQLLPLYCIMRI